MPVQSVTMAPPATAWRSSLRQPGRSEIARRFRMQLGLPTDRPVIFSGHQAIVWHAGILAKYLAAAHVAAACGGAAAWVVVDQDPEDFAALRIPVHTANGRLAVETVDVTDEPTAALVRSGAPPCSIPRFQVAGLDRSPAVRDASHHAAPSIMPGLSAIIMSLAAAEGATAAEQVSAATARLTSPLVGGVRHVLVSQLGHTDALASLVTRMTEDPARCHHCYNDAVRLHPDAGIAPLAADQRGSVELPLWHIDPRSGLRRRVFAADLATLHPAQLMPRALLLTALLRLCGCELFIHGAGGGASAADTGYDRVTETWISEWLGEPLAPAVLVSATVTLALDGLEGVTAEQVEAARQLARKARHDPALVGDSTTAARKRELLARISTTRDKQEKARLFDAMKQLLGQAEVANAPKFAELDRHAEELAAKLADQPIAADRTWAFPLLDPADLRELSQRLKTAIG